MSMNGNMYITDDFNSDVPTWSAAVNWISGSGYGNAALLTTDHHYPALYLDYQSPLYNRTGTSINAFMQMHRNGSPGKRWINMLSDLVFPVFSRLFPVAGAVSGYMPMTSSPYENWLWANWYGDDHAIRTVYSRDKGDNWFNMTDEAAERGFDAVAPISGKRGVAWATKIIDYGHTTGLYQITHYGATSHLVVDFGWVAYARAIHSCPHNASVAYFGLRKRVSPSLVQKFRQYHRGELMDRAGFTLEPNAYIFSRL